MFLSISLFTRTWSLKSIFNIQVSFLCIFSMFRMACSVIIFGSKLHAKLQHIINGIILNNVVCIIIQKIALKRVLHSFVQTNNVIKQIWNSRRPNAKLHLCNLYFVTYTQYLLIYNIISWFVNFVAKILYTQLCIAFISIRISICSL